MKTAICPNCYWYHADDDPLFPKRETCDCYNRPLDGIVITQCRHFREVEQ